jgi:hypothetical protein
MFSFVLEADFVKTLTNEMYKKGKIFKNQRFFDYGITYLPEQNILSSGIPDLDLIIIEPLIPIRRKLMRIRDTA